MQGMMKNIPGPRAPPVTNRPSLNITARSYSWTTWCREEKKERKTNALYRENTSMLKQDKWNQVKVSSIYACHSRVNDHFNIASRASALNCFNCVQYASNRTSDQSNCKQLNVKVFYPSCALPFFHWLSEETTFFFLSSSLSLSFPFSV